MNSIEKNQGLLTQEEILEAQMFQDFEDFGYVKLFEAGRGKPPKGMKWVVSKSGNVYAVKIDGRSKAKNYAVKIDGRSKAKKATDTGKKPTEPKKSTKPTTDEETEVKKTKTVKLSPGKGDPFPEPKQFDPNSKEKKKDRVKSAAIKLKKSANNELETIETKNKKQENAKKIIANSVEKVQNKISSNLEKNEDVDLDKIIVDEFGNAMKEFAKTNPKEEDFDETTLMKGISSRIAKLEKFGISSVSDYEDYIKNKITKKIKALPGYKWMKFAFFSVFTPFKKLAGFLDDLYEKSEPER